MTAAPDDDVDRADDSCVERAALPVGIFCSEAADPFLREVMGFLGINGMIMAPTDKFLTNLPNRYSSSS